MRNAGTTEQLSSTLATTTLQEEGRPEAGAAGRVLDRYELRSRLGSGGFGVVWLAYDLKLEREVAVKVIPRERGSSGSGRPQREARAAARLNHPGIVALYELAADEDAVYLVSELVRGRTFAELCHGCGLSDRDVARIGVALCDALEHAHAREVIHRDVKPQNVIVAAQPAAGAGFAKLADFGVAHLTDGDPLTRTGDVVGTLAYMAPEQAEGRRVTAAADVYSLALTLYEGWTGSNPVRAAGPAATARRLGRRLPPLARKRRGLPAQLCGAVDAALDPLPDRRPPLGELRTALAAAEPELADEGGLVERRTLERFGLSESRPLPFGTGRALPRIGAGGMAGLLVLVALEALGPEPPFSPFATAAVAALVVALLPRLGWLAAACGLLAWLVSPEGGEPGTALVLAAFLAPTPLLLPRFGPAWSVPALAPLAGIIALAPLFVAVAGLAPTAWRRAGLAACGFLWLAGCEVLSGKTLLFGPAEGTEPPGAWDESLAHAAADALLPFITSPAGAPIAVYVIFAVVAPYFVRASSGALTIIGASAWAAGLAATLGWLGGALAPWVETSTGRGAAAGAVLGAFVALAGRAGGLGRQAGYAPPLP